MKQYPLRIDNAFWNKVQGKARSMGLTAKEVIVTLLSMWISGEVKVDKK